MAGDDLAALAAAVGKRLGGRQLAVAESVTTGRVAQLFGETGGSTDWFRGGLVAWQHVAKYELLGVPDGDPVVTAGAAETMAAGAARLFGTAVAIATTGAAGPSGQDGAPPGSAYVATWIDGATAVRHVHGEGTPDEICQTVARAALELLLDGLTDTPD